MDDFDPVSLVQPAATRVRDPRSGRSVWLAGLVKNARMDGEALRFDLVFTPDHARDDRRAIEEALLGNLRGLGVSGEILVDAKMGPAASKPVAMPRPPGAPDPVPGMSGPGMAPHGGPIQKKQIPGVKRVIAVASGKGGVGKSTVATNLAVGLRKSGWDVGLLDADIYGPSLPRMMNVGSRPFTNERKQLVPVLSYGVRCVSVGLLVDESEAMIWRGPMIMGLIRQFLQDTDWGELDCLVIDLPPGTGDAQLTLIQAVDLTGAVIVTTPQDVALADAVRGVTMFNKLSVPILGLVENMAYYALPDGTRDHVFGVDGGKRLAEREGVPLLGEIPLQTSIRKGGDSGLPAVLGQDPVGAAFQAMADAVRAQLEAGEVGAGA
jgi:ATP-binding protein involved in chromosome partitioning